MNNQPLVVERIFHSPVAKVWDALTKNEKLRQWYFQLEDFQPVVGFEFQFEGSDKGVVFVHHCRITEVIPEKVLEYTWRYEDMEGNSIVRFELQQVDPEHTKVIITHSGLETFPQENSSFRVESFKNGWTSILGNSLRKYLEE